jgi:hypothetical protein
VISRTGITEIPSLASCSIVTVVRIATVQGADRFGLYVVPPGESCSARGIV